MRENTDYTAVTTARKAFDALVALGDAPTDEQVIEVVRGIGYDAFRVLDEKPGQWSPSYTGVEGWRILRCIRNGSTHLDVNLFDVLNEKGH